MTAASPTLGATERHNGEGRGKDVRRRPGAETADSTPSGRRRTSDDAADSTTAPSGRETEGGRPTDGPEQDGPTDAAQFLPPGGQVVTRRAHLTNHQHARTGDAAGGAPRAALHNEALADRLPRATGGSHTPPDPPPTNHDR